MHPGPSRRSPIVAIVIALTLMVGALPALAAEPQPVVPVEPPPAPDTLDPIGPDPGCVMGSAQSSSSGLVLDGADPGTRTAYPGPVVPVPGPIDVPLSDCTASLSLQLIVKSPDEREPDGADASLDAISVPRSSLESGFEVNLPAQDRLITLSDPGPKWKLVETSCSCTGGPGLSATVGAGPLSRLGSGLATYPGPVIPVLVAPGGSGGCSGPSSGALAPVASPLSPASPISRSIFGPAEVTAYPAPVVPVGVVQRPASVSWDASGTVDITDPDGVGGAFSCVWTVEARNGDLAIRTVTKPAGQESRFDYLATPTGAQALDASPVTLPGTPAPGPASLESGPWSVELRNLQPEWELTDSDCNESDATMASVAQGAGAVAGVDPLDSIACTFKLKLLSPKPGRWRSRNGASRVSCNGRNLKLGASSDVARLAVRDDGNRLIGRPLSQGGITRWDLRRDQDDLLRYTGTAKLSIAGARGTFEAELELVNEKRLVGTMSGTMKIGAATCSFRRSLKLSHVGGN